jgi:nicotinamidase-related amidase
MADTPASQPAEFMEPQEADYVIRKRRYDSFFQTTLDLTLRELGVSSVVLIGCDTNICVAHTAAGAYYRNYDVYVASDATYTFLYGTQEGGLDLMRHLYDATVLTSEEIVSLLGA